MKLFKIYSNFRDGFVVNINSPKIQSTFAHSPERFKSDLSIHLQIASITQLASDETGKRTFCIQSN